MTTGGPGATSALGVLFAALVDDAGLFPPERLVMDDAVARHRSDEAAAHPVLTHRFLCPASGLPELQSRLQAHDRWRIGVIDDVGLHALVPVVQELLADPRLDVETVELRMPATEDPRAAAALVSSALPYGGAGRPQVHVEISPAVEGWQRALEAIDEAGLAAKVRCGGLEAAAFPTSEQLAAFLVAVVASATPFKATAGLHHAVRYRDPRTGFTHHGFLNLLFALCRAVEQADRGQVADVLRIENGPLLADRVRAVDPPTASHARSLFRAYGSCSTSEPVEDLAALGLLGVTAA